jgi:hypothetical protein
MKYVQFLVVFSATEIQLKKQHWTVRRGYSDEKYLVMRNQTITLS